LKNKVRESQDHVFVSYAIEDSPFVEWLVYKLTTLGYKVWCDRIKIYGGEPYPKDIDYAIKSRTHRFLAVMSKHSVDKPNPRKERTIAHHISRNRKINFIIPLNIGLKPTDLDWMTSDLSYIDFTYNWAKGLVNLLKALRKAVTPCPLKNGMDVVSNSIISEEVINKKPETIYSNLLRIKKIPEAISVIRFRRRLNPLERKKLNDIWASHQIKDLIFLSFHMPPKSLPFEVQNAYLWENTDTIEGIDTHNVISELLRKNLNCHCLAKGLSWSVDRRWLYFPFGLTQNNRVSFIDTYGKKNNIQVCGERKFFTPGKSSRYRYYLSPTFKIMRKMFGEDFIVKLGLRIRITDTIGNSIAFHSAHARRKNLSKDWWNYEWISRYLAVCNFLCNNNEIIIGKQDPYRLIFSAKPLIYISPISINEKRINNRRRKRKVPVF
jgi:hypothetical protein